MFMLSLALLQSPVVAFAADDDEDSYLEEGDEDKGKKSKSKSKKETQVREIVRGPYAKANAGVAAFLLPPWSGAVSAGTLVSLAGGYDFVDNERSSMAFEVALAQGLHNGLAWECQADPDTISGCPAGLYPLTEGDLRTYTGMVNFEYSAYLSRRLGIGARLGGGVMWSPLLMDKDFYNSDVVPAYGGDPGLHNSIVPMVFGGPTFEYYTKLSHFSLGVDIDVAYYIGWSLAVNGSGSLKYTF